MNQEVLKAKQQQVETITADLEKSKALVVVEYRGLTVAELTELRRSLRAVNATLSVFKNSLVERALKDKATDEVKEILAGPNAFVFSEDVCAGPKVLRKFSRQNDRLVIKGGLLEGKFANAEKVNEIAKLPGKEGLISMFLSVLQAPARNLACALKAVADAK
jgi:large subunit ribosomal protein L10